MEAFKTPFKMKGWKQELMTGCSVHSQVFWGKVGEDPEETQWRSMEDTQADRQFSGSSEQISPHIDQTEGSPLLTHENSVSTEPPHLEWPC